MMTNLRFFSATSKFFKEDNCLSVILYFQTVLKRSISDQPEDSLKKMPVFRFS